MGDEAVGIAPEPAEVRQPGIPSLDRPAQSERQALLASVLFFAADEIVDADTGDVVAHDVVVIAAVEVKGLDLF